MQAPPRNNEYNEMFSCVPTKVNYSIPISRTHLTKRNFLQFSFQCFHLCFSSAFVLYAKDHLPLNKNQHRKLDFWGKLFSKKSHELNAKTNERKQRNESFSFYFRLVLGIIDSRSLNSIYRNSIVRLWILRSSFRGSHWIHGDSIPAWDGQRQFSALRLLIWNFCDC